MSKVSNDDTMAMLRKQKRMKKFRKNLPFILMMLLPLTLFILTRYWPMFGVVMAFQDYKVGAPFIGPKTKWVGVKWFNQLFRSPLFKRSLRNTLVLSGLTLAISFPVSIILALLLNEIANNKFRHLCSNISLLPYFISTVVLVGIMKNFLSVDSGIINMLIEKLGGERIDFFNSEDWFRPLYIISGIWKSAGFSAVIYTAAISGIDPQLYEAAAIDGSTRFKNLYKITIPCILPTIVINCILKIGSLLSVGYDKILLMYSPSIYEKADVLSTYSYRMGIVSGKMSLATAISVFDSVCNLILLVVANRIARKVSDTSLF